MINNKIKVQNFVPRNGRILVEQDPADKSIVILKNAIRPNTGKILRVDPKAPEFGFKEGDRVMFYEGSGILVMLENKEFRLMHSKEVLGDIVDDTQS